MVQEPDDGPPGAGSEGGIKGKLTRIDQYQQRHPWLAFPVGVIKKFGDDKAGKLAALMAYYGFFSLFPLLLVFVSVLGFVLGDNTKLQQDVVDSVLGRLPIIGDSIKVGSLRGSGLALAVGLAVAVWGGLAVMQAAQDAMNQVWEVPMKERPNFLKSRLRSVVMLAVLGVGIVGATLLAGLATGGTDRPLPVQLAALAVSLLVNLGLFLAAFRVLTVRTVSVRDLLAGAAVAAVAAAVLQALGGWVIGSKLGTARQTYGTFAFVIVLLSWLSLQAQVTLFAAEINVVRARRLWPRSLLQDPLAEADKEVLTEVVKVEERHPEQEVDVRFNEQPGDDEPPGPPVGDDADDGHDDRDVSSSSPDDLQAAWMASAPAKKAAPRRTKAAAPKPVKTAAKAKAAPKTTRARSSSRRKSG